VKVPYNPLAKWKAQFTFLTSAEREFLGLPKQVQVEFIAIFPEFAAHPWSASPTLDVQPLREMPGRWRLKIESGHRGIYRSLHGRPDFEMFETRDQVYARLRRYMESRG
jgi:hypothetical protein